jgi:hypothetical protein
MERSQGTSDAPWRWRGALARGEFLSFRSGWRRAPYWPCRTLRSLLVGRGAFLIHFDCHNGIAAWFPLDPNQASSL